MSGQPDIIDNSRTQDLNEEMNSFEVCKLVVIGVDTDAEEEAGVAAVNDLVVAELGALVSISCIYTEKLAHLDEVGLVLLVARGYQPVYFTTQANLWKGSESQGHCRCWAYSPSPHRRRERTT